MASRQITIEELLIVTFVLIDDWYQKNGKQLAKRIAGAHPKFSDSELLTLMIAIDFFEFTSERRYLSFIRANYLHLFPNLIDQSQFNRRSRKLTLVLEHLRREWLLAMNAQFENQFLIDTTPVVVVGYRRDKERSQFFNCADYGYCAARKLKYYGFKLVMLTTLDGTPFSFELVPANTDERSAADEILGTLPVRSNVWSDKGFIGEDWQALWRLNGVFVWTTKRGNQKVQNPKPFDELLNSVRERVEGAFDILKEGGRSVEKTLARTISGLSSRVANKIAGVTFRSFLRRFFGIDTLTYSLKF